MLWTLIVAMVGVWMVGLLTACTLVGMILKFNQPRTTNPSDGGSLSDTEPCG